jgi:hypothetical protein
VATGAEKQRILTEMSDYGMNIIRDQFRVMEIKDRESQLAILNACFLEAKANNLKADKESLKKFGRMRFKHYPPYDAFDNPVRLSKKLRFGVFFQLVGKGFIK